MYQPKRSASSYELADFFIISQFYTRTYGINNLLKLFNSVNLTAYYIMRYKIQQYRNLSLIIEYTEHSNTIDVGFYIWRCLQ